jgi:hypothetical protein
VHAFFRAHADERSPRRKPSGHPLSPVRLSAGEETRCRRDRPTEACDLTVPREERRHFEDQDAFHRHVRVDRGGIAPSTPRVGLPLTPPAPLPAYG